jgi:hypothetical protein
MVVGSWVKVRSYDRPGDIDVLFALPKSVYDRYQLEAISNPSPKAELTA